jgi:hypothetical protein
VKTSLLLNNKPKKDSMQPKSKKKSIVSLITGAVIVGLLLVFFNQLIFSFQTSNLFERSKFNFKTIQVNDVVSADAEKMNLETLSVYQQPLFLNQELMNKSKSNLRPSAQNENLQIKFDFYWNGFIEQYDNPYLDYSNEKNFPFIESSHIEEKNYDHLVSFGLDNHNIVKRSVSLENHVFFINYLTLNFTNLHGERTLFEMGQLNKPNFLGESGAHWSSEISGSNSGFGTFSQVPIITEGESEGEIDPRKIDPIEIMNQFAIPKENYLIEVLESGLKVEIFLELDSNFQAELVDISAIQIVGVERNDINRVHFMVINFSSFGRSERLNLSNIGFPKTNSGNSNETQTNDLYYDFYSRFKIDENNEVSVGFFEPLNERVNLDYDIKETFLIFSNDPNSLSFDDTTFLYDFDLDRLLSDTIIAQDTDGFNGLEHAKESFGNDALSNLKLNGIIEYNMYKGDISNFTFNIYTPNKVETFSLGTPIFNYIYYLNTGIFLSDDAFLIPMKLIPSAKHCNNSTPNLCQINLKIASKRIQKVLVIKNILIEIKDLYEGVDIDKIMGWQYYLPNYFWGKLYQMDGRYSYGVEFFFDNKELDFISEKNPGDEVFLQLKHTIDQNKVFFEIEKEVPFIRPNI